MDDLILDLVGWRSSFLADWMWLLKRPHRPVLLTVMGDVFLENEMGEVVLLDTLNGKLVPVASSRPEFDRRLQDPENVDYWFMPDIVAQVRAHGMRTSAGDCFSFKRPPILGGAVGADNVEVTSVEAHLSYLGDLHCQIQELPPDATGAKVTVADKPSRHMPSGRQRWAGQLVLLSPGIATGAIAAFPLVGLHFDGWIVVVLVGGLIAALVVWRLTRSGSSRRVMGLTKFGWATAIIAAVAGGFFGTLFIHWWMQ